ncbi:MAG: hypothetical protein H0U09_11390 [Geodermatophilaceae bacterium]|nr:hypothetical protein [Geodermatophilaceae bacterium]
MRVLHRVERGLWQRVLPGVFVTHGGTPTADELARAALAFAGDCAALSGSHALQRFGIRAAPAGALAAPGAHAAA